MNASDPIRAALERLVELDDGCTADHWHAAITAARAALAAAPEGQPSDQEIADVFSQGCRDLSRSYEPPFLGGARAIFARWGRPAARSAPLKGEVGELVAALRKASDGASAMGWEQDSWVIARAATLLSQLSAATPPAPLEGEVGELVAALENDAECVEVEQNHLCNMTADQMRRAATLLSQLSAATPAAVPIPVSEQPWKLPGWCDGQGRCWLLYKGESDWRLIDPINSGVPQLRYCFSHSLPAHALPLPAPQGGEVEG